MLVTELSRSAEWASSASVSSSIFFEQVADNGADDNDIRPTDLVVDPLFYIHVERATRKAEVLDRPWPVSVGDPSQGKTDVAVIAVFIGHAYKHSLYPLRF